MECTARSICVLTKCEGICGESSMLVHRWIITFELISTGRLECGICIIYHASVEQNINTSFSSKRGKLMQMYVVD